MIIKSKNATYVNKIKIQACLISILVDLISYKRAVLSVIERNLKNIIKCKEEM